MGGGFPRTGAGLSVQDPSSVLTVTVVRQQEVGAGSSLVTYMAQAVILCLAILRTCPHICRYVVTEGCHCFGSHVTASRAQREGWSYPQRVSLLSSASGGARIANVWHIRPSLLEWVLVGSGWGMAPGGSAPCSDTLCILNQTPSFTY